MSCLLNRLKFDIYERVNLDDKNEDIKVIEETELTPQIKMLLSKDEVKLVGNLLLKIKYIGDVPFQSNEFEHNIPVEITIPSSRVTDAWKIDADIENFNIDLLSGRAVDVTGVMVVYEKESVKVDKVKLPKEVAAAIEFIRKGFAESSVHDVKWLEGPIDDNDEVRKAKDTILNFTAKRGYPDQFSPNHTLIIYHKALVNGYEVEQTPEDKVRDQYAQPRHFLNKDEDTEADIYRKGIKFALDTLNIKIEGINT